MSDSTVPIRFATFLSPLLYETYAHIARYVGDRVGCRTTLEIGQSFEEFAERLVDVAFNCGAKQLWKALIERLVAVKDEDYGNIREMLEKVEGMEFPFE